MLETRRCAMVVCRRGSLVSFGLLIFSVCFVGARSDPPVSSDCFQGPDFWCFNQTTEAVCRFTDKRIGVCGYSNKRCQIKTGDEFCQTSTTQLQQSPLAFNGGLTGADEGLFFYYMLSLYWPPSSCPAVYNETIDFRRYFCSPYTDRGQPGSERLVLHGLWPTFATDGNYQGWSQFCSASETDWSQCHIDGNLCPWANATKSDFTQDDYEYCLAVEGVDPCLVDASTVLLPEQERLKVLAPGYLNDRNLFINHEWTKHGSCCSSIFNNNISNYLAQMLDLVDTVTQSGSLTYQYIQRYAGEKIGLAYLIAALNHTAIINCNNKCELEEVWMCVERNISTGLPNGLMACPAGARYASDSCQKARCAYVYIPLRSRDFEEDILSGDILFPQFASNLVKLIFLFIAVKYFVVLLGVCYSAFFFN